MNNDIRGERLSEKTPFTHLRHNMFLLMTQEIFWGLQCTSNSNCDEWQVKLR